jgi:hypothetical protein
MNLREAAQQALEACPFCGNEPSFSGNASDWKDESRYVELSLGCCVSMTEQIGWRRARDMTHEAKTAELQNRLRLKWNTRAALAQQEPRNQCGETCERAKLCAVCARGLEQEEPLSVEDLARALVASRVIDAAALDDPEGYDDGVTLERVRGLHRRLAALAQQEQEPVAWIAPNGELRKDRSARKFSEWAWCQEDYQPLYTHPPRREWVSLTEEEVWSQYQTLWPFHPAEEPRLAADISKFARAIEQACKEKNHG